MKMIVDVEVKGDGFRADFEFSNENYFRVAGHRNLKKMYGTFCTKKVQKN